MIMTIMPLILVGWFFLPVVRPTAFVPLPPTTPPRLVPQLGLGVTPSGDDVTRRDFTGIFGTGILTSMILLFPQFVAGVTNDESTTTTQPTLRSATEIASVLHPVPTFTIVDADGIPFMVVGEDARVTGYFFTTYTEAQRILTLARTSVDASIRDERTKLQRSSKIITESKDSPPPVLVNPWKSARISTVPLDVAVTLSLKGLNGNVRNYFLVAAAETDIETALNLTHQTNLAEGKVPLFYISDWTLNTKMPLYFSKDQLIRAYQTQNPSQLQQPVIQVTELFAVLTAMATSLDDDDDIVLVPPMQSDQWVRKCTAQNQGRSPFVLGQRNIVL